MNDQILKEFNKNRTAKKKLFAVLVDPDQLIEDRLRKVVEQSNNAKVDYFFVGGSLLLRNDLDQCLELIQANSDIPTVLFPGSSLQINDRADGILFLSLISGRNPELLIGQHVTSAPLLKESALEIIPTGYMLVDGGRSTTVSYISNTIPIPSDKDDIAVSTAMAGEMLGLKTIYMDAGSGAQKPITDSMISKVNQNINVPFIVGGGIKAPEQAVAVCRAGADVIVVGDAIEKDESLLTDMSIAIHSTTTVSS